MSAPSTLRGKVFTNNFDCDLNPHIIRISPIRAYFPLVSNSDGRHTEYECFEPGAPCWENLTVDFYAHEQSLQPVQDWIKTAYNGDDARKTFSVNVKNQAQEIVRTYNIIDALPVRYTKVNMGASGSGNETMVKMTVEMRVDRIEAA